MVTLTIFRQGWFCRNETYKCYLGENPGLNGHALGIAVGFGQARAVPGRKLRKQEVFELSKSVM